MLPQGDDPYSRILRIIVLVWLISVAIFICLGLFEVAEAISRVQARLSRLNLSPLSLTDIIHSGSHSPVRAASQGLTGQNDGNKQTTNVGPHP
jgi:hypothetical protein